MVLNDTTLQYSSPKSRADPMTHIYLGLVEPELHSVRLVHVRVRLPGLPQSKFFGT